MLRFFCEPHRPQAATPPEEGNFFLSSGGMKKPEIISQASFLGFFTIRV